MTDGASGSSPDELKYEEPGGRGIALAVVIGIFCILSFMLGAGWCSFGKDDCQAEWKRAKEIPLHKHGVRK